MTASGRASTTTHHPELVRKAARAYAEAHGHRYLRGASFAYGCECSRCGAAMAWSDADAFVHDGNVAALGSLARSCPGVMT